ncbi:hypothetical protein ACOCJ5_04730 [Knoellia sp. CPCC 206450]
MTARDLSGARVAVVGASGALGSLLARRIVDALADGELDLAAEAFGKPPR